MIAKWWQSDHGRICKNNSWFAVHLQDRTNEERSGSGDQPNRSKLSMLSLFKFRAALWSEKNNRSSLSILDLSFHVSGLSSGPILWISFQALDEQSETDQESVLLSKTLSCWIWATGKTSFYNQKISLLIYSSSVNWSVKWSTHTRGLHTRLAALNSTDPFKTGSSIELWGSL